MRIHITRNYVCIVNHSNATWMHTNRSLVAVSVLLLLSLMTSSAVGQHIVIPWRPYLPGFEPTPPPPPPLPVFPTFRVTMDTDAPPTPPGPTLPPYTGPPTTTLPPPTTLPPTTTTLGPPVAGVYTGRQLYCTCTSSQSMAAFSP